MRRRVLTAKILPALLSALLLFSSFSVPAAAAQITAPDSIQLEKTEGDVSATSAGGRELTVRSEMRLYNGNRIQTSAASYAWIDMGSGWQAKLDASSLVQVHSSGATPELLLEYGGIFFDDTAAADLEQPLSLRTPVMSAAVQGACGWIEATSRWTARLFVLYGSVQCTVTDPVTGESETATVENGQSATLTVYPQDHQGDKCSIRPESFMPADVSGYVLEDLAQDVTLCGAIYDAMGMDVLSPLGLLGSLQRQLDEIKMLPAQMRGQIDEKGDEQQIHDNLATFDQTLSTVADALASAGLSAQGQQDLQQAKDLQLQARQALDEGKLLDAANLLEDAWGSLVAASAADEAVNVALIQAEEKLIEEQLAVRERQDVIDEQLAAQNENATKSVLWAEPTPSPSPSPSPDPAGGGGGGGGGTSSTPAPVTPSPEPTPTVLVMGTFTLDELQQALHNSTAGVTLVPSSDPTQNVLTVEAEKTLFVPTGRTLTLQADTTDPDNPVYIGIDVQAGATMTVTGTLVSDKECSVTNHGTLRSSGQFDPKIFQEAGTLSVAGGTISNGIVVHGGTVNISEGTVHYGIVQESKTGDVVDSNVTITTKGKVVGGYYYHYIYDAELMQKLLEEDPDYQPKQFNFALAGGTIEYLAAETPAAGGALVLDTGAFDRGTLYVNTGSTLDGAEAAAILVSGQFNYYRSSLNKEAVVKSLTDTPVVFAGGAEGAIPYGSKFITPSSYLVVEQPEGEGEDTASYYVLKDVYANFADALAAGGTVTLTRDVEAAVEALASEAVLDLNGHTLKLTTPFTLTGKLTVQDSVGGGKLISDAEGYVLSLGDNWQGQIVIAEGVTVLFKSGVFILGDESNPNGYTPTGYKVEAPAEDAEEPYYTLVPGEGVAPPTPSPEPTESPAPSPTDEVPPTEPTDAPATDAPATDAPATDAPATDAPATDAPATDAPTTDAPATDAPATDAPATDAPATDAPATEGPGNTEGSNDMENSSDTEAPGDTETPGDNATEPSGEPSAAPPTEPSSEPSQTDPQPADSTNSEEGPLA